MSDRLHYSTVIIDAHTEESLYCQRTLVCFYLIVENSVGEVSSAKMALIKINLVSLSAFVSLTVYIIYVTTSCSGFAIRLLLYTCII